MRPKIFFLVLTAVIISACVAFGAKVILKDGVVIEGRIAGEAIMIEGPAGDIKYIPKNMIEKIVEEEQQQTAESGIASSKPELVIQSSHGDYAITVDFSPDGKLVASGGRDALTKIWNASTGELIRNLTGHTGNVNRVIFSPDGKMIATASSDNTVRLWDVQTGAQVKILTGHESSINAEAFSPDGKTIAAVSYNSNIILWDIQSGAITRTIKSPTDVSKAVDFSADGRYIAAAGSGDLVAVWDAATGELLHSLEGHVKDVNSVAFSPDGTILAASTGDSKVRIWDTADWRLKHTLTGFGGMVKWVSFNKDGSQLATSSEEPSIQMWDTKTWKGRSMLGMMPFKAFSVAFSPDGRTLASAHINRSVYLWNTASRKKTREMRTYTYSVVSTAFSPDGKKLAFTSDYKRVRLWDLETGEPSLILNGHTDIVTSVLFSPGGKLIATCSGDSTVRLWDIASGKEIFNFEGHSGPVYSVDFSPDGARLVSAGEDGILRVWNVPDGTLASAIDTNEKDLFAAVFSPDGKTIASGGISGIVGLWDSSEGKLIKKFSGHKGEISGIAFSKNGKSLYSAGTDTRIVMFSVETGKTLAENKSSGGPMHSIAMSPDGSTIATTEHDLTATLWNTSTLAPIRTLSGHTNVVKTANFSPDGRLIATGSDDNTLKLWNTATGEMLATIVSLDFTMSVSMSYLNMNNNWFVTDAAGRFDCSGCVRGDAQSGKKYIRWRVGNTLFAPDQFFDIFFEPGLLSDIVKLGTIPRIKGIESVLSSLPPEIKIVWPQNGMTTQNPDTKVKIEVQDMGGGIENVRLMSHGRPAGGLPSDVTPDGFPDGKKLYQFEVQLMPGENRMTALATSRTGIDSHEDEVIVSSKAEASRNANLYLLSVGINEYKNSEFNLNLAVSDAESFADAITGGGAALYSDVHEKRLMNSAVTRDALNAALDEILKNAQPPDMVVVYIAGHGIIAGGGWFFLTHETLKTDTQYIRDNAFSEREMKAFLKKLPARKVVLVLDACQSGGIAMNMSRGLEKEKILGELARTTGTFILAASTDAQSAMESGSLGHGVFTYVLLEGLSGKADVNKSGSIEVKELEIYANDKVPEYTEKYYGRRQDPFIWEVAGGGGISGFGPTLTLVK